MNQSLAKIQIIVDSKADFRQQERSERANYFVRKDPELAIELGLNGVLLSDLESDVSAMRASHPSLLIGGLAMDLADCKNWELKEVDFIQFVVPENGSEQGFILGSELLQDLIPREEEYGWMLLSLNTPVFALGLSNFNELEITRSKASIYGLVLSHQFEPKLSLEERITKSLNLLI